MAGNDELGCIIILCQRSWQRTEKYPFCAFSAANDLCRTSSLCREQLGVLLPSRQCSLPGRVAPTSVDPSVWGRAMRSHMRNHKVWCRTGIRFWCRTGSCRSVLRSVYSLTHEATRAYRSSSSPKHRAHPWWKWSAVNIRSHVPHGSCRSHGCE